MMKFLFVFDLFVFLLLLFFLREIIFHILLQRFKKEYFDLIHLSKTNDYIPIDCKSK
jgi:hypothetical protein